MLSPISLASPRAGDGIRILAIAQNLLRSFELTLASATPQDHLPTELRGLAAHWSIHLQRRPQIYSALRVTLPWATYDSVRYRYGIDLPGPPQPRFDVAYVNLPQGWSLWERIRGRVIASKVVVDVQNDEQDMWLQRAEDEQSLLVRQACFHFARGAAARTRRILTDSDALIVVSGRDRDTLEQTHGHLVDTKVSIVPNGVDTNFFRPTENLTRKPNSAVFTGSLDTRMNQKAVVNLLSEWPRVLERDPSATLTIVGRNPPSWLLRTTVSSVSVVASPRDIRPYLWKAGAFVAPYSTGGGTKIKILEAMAAGAPVICSRAAVQGLPVVAGRHYLAIDHVEDLPEALVSLAANGRAETISREGAAVASTFDWSIITKGAVDCVGKLASQVS